MELHGLIGYPHCHFGREQLYLRGLAFRRLALVQQMRNLLPEDSSLGNLSGHVGQRKAQSLKLTDRMTELLALLEPPVSPREKVSFCNPYGQSVWLRASADVIRDEKRRQLMALD